MQKTIIINKELVPSPGFGTYELRGQACQQATAHALHIGYRHIDTAQMYANEDAVGAAIRNSGITRTDIFLTTKVWATNFSQSKFIASVEQSLKQLKLEYVDLLLLHWPSDDETTKLATDLLNKCLQLGYTRLIGVSNFNVPQLTQARKQAPVCCNQVEYHPYISQEKTLQYMQQHNLLLTAYSPLALGKVAKDPVLLSLANKYKRTVGQVTLRWLMQQKNVAPIPKAASEKHRAENISLFDFHLEEQDMRRILAIAGHKGQVNPAWAPGWDK